MKHVVYDCDNTLGVLFSDVDDGLALLYLLGGAGDRRPPRHHDDLKNDAKRGCVKTVK